MKEVRETCPDEGVLQGYLDGELSPGMMESVAAHISHCAPCTQLAAEAEGEMALFETAFAAETALPVPTANLRARINRAIDELQAEPHALPLKSERGPRAWLASLVGPLALKPQRAFGFAGITALVVSGFLFWSFFWPGQQPENSGDGQQVASASPSPQAGTGKVKDVAQTAEDAPALAEASPAPSVTRPVRNSPYVLPVKAVRRQENGPAPASGNVMKETQPQLLAELPGEKNYLKTIDSLKSVIEASDATTLSPTLRAEYERNLAVVDQAIAATQRQARRKPADTATTQFLYAAYQSKIDLLSAVADQQSQFVARR